MSELRLQDNSSVLAGDSLELVPLRALNEFVYCPRLHHLMYVQGIFVQNADTIEGAAQHRRAEKRRPKRPRTRKQSEEKEDEAEAVSPWPVPPAELYLGSPVLGLVGKLDAMRIEDGRHVPVEYKRGAAPAPDRTIELEGQPLCPGAWPGDQIQVAAQVMLLEANGYSSSYGLLHYRASHSTVRIALDEPLRALVRIVAERTRAGALAPMPQPLIDSPKCVRCSLNTVCLPEETNTLLKRIEEPRRIVPGRDDGGCLYLVTQGARVGLDGEALRITLPDLPEERVLLKDVASVVVMGNVQVTTQALVTLMEAGRPVTYTTRTGRLLGTACGLTGKNVALRRQQLLAAEKHEAALAIARGIVQSKISNQRTLLRRSGRVAEAALEELTSAVSAAARSPDVASLLGEEGRAAHVYFREFPSLLQEETRMRSEMDGRNRRPPRDPVNAMLSFGYALLAKDAATACAATGFDPMIGFLHAMRAGRPALALDLMEAFRPLVVDSIVVRCVNTRAVTPESFHRSQAGVILSAPGRLAFLKAYEQRMDELITNPVFGYRMRYRRMLELEARLLARHLEGELPAYRPLTTR
ncbi:MAG: CRISPR-associated endonuclease Cas1 [Candidatus Wallbacteria bacterium]|nr:CRISPR-associated endonuclease Cas1 [Candidatus Wallbacteria bacterium]